MMVVTEYMLLWQDHLIEVIHTKNWCGQIGLDHLAISCVSPERAALPITETGYKSQFTHGDYVIRAGGAVACVKAWLDDASQALEWQAHTMVVRQGALF